MEVERRRWKKESEKRVGVKVEEEELACVLYRSSEAGKPEGIGIRHGQLVRGMGEEGAGERVGMRVSFSQEGSCVEVLRALGEGGCGGEYRRGRRDAGAEEAGDGGAGCGSGEAMGARRCNRAIGARVSVGIEEGEGGGV